MAPSGPYLYVYSLRQKLSELLCFFYVWLWDAIALIEANITTMLIHSVPVNQPSILISFGEEKCTTMAPKSLDQDCSLSLISHVLPLMTHVRRASQTLEICPVLVRNILPGGYTLRVFLGLALLLDASELYSQIWLGIFEKWRGHFFFF